MTPERYDIYFVIIGMSKDPGRTALNCYNNVKMEPAQKLVFKYKGDDSESLMLLPEALRPHVQV